MRAHIPLIPRILKGGTCKVSGCERPHNCRGYCASHYQRLQVFGDAHEGVPIGELRGKVSSQVWPLPRSRYRYGERTNQTRADRNRYDRERRRRRAANAGGTLSRRKRLEVVRRVEGGQHVSDACEEMGIDVGVLWARARMVPAWGRELDVALMATRDPGISHGTEYSYKVHRCRCPQCRAAKAAYR